MGFWDAVYYAGDQLKALTPTLSTVKQAGGATYRYTSAAVTKIDQVVRVDGIQKLPHYWNDEATRAQIGLFTKILAKKARNYVLYEGFKHIPGVSVAEKLVSESMREMKQENRKDEMKSMQAKIDKLEKESTESFTQNRKLSPLNAVEGESEKTQDVIKAFMKTEFVGNHMFRDLMIPKIARTDNKND